MKPYGLKYQDTRANCKAVCPCCYRGYKLKTYKQRARAQGKKEAQDAISSLKTGDSKGDVHE